MILVYNSKHHHLVHVPVVPDCFIQFYMTERTMGSPVCGVWGEVKSAGFSRCYLLVVFSRPSYLTSGTCLPHLWNRNISSCRPQTAWWGSIYSQIMLVRSKWFCFIDVSPGTAWICHYSCTANKSARFFKVFSVINHLVVNRSICNLLLLS